jgi:predicted secreted protein
MFLKSLLVPLLFATAVPVQATEEVLFNRVYLDAQAEREIPNDEMRVVLYVEQQGRDAATLAERINQDMNWALEIVKGEKSVAAASGNYRTVPLYENRLIARWRVSQDLELVSTSIERLTELTGRLQERLQVRSMEFRPTKSTRDRHQEQLMEEARSLFKRRAEIVGRHMPSRQYRIVELHVNAGGGPVPLERMRAAVLAMDAAPAPAVEAGTSLLTVTVSGNVQFQ